MLFSTPISSFLYFFNLNFLFKSNRYQEISDKTDHRTNGYKTRKESMLAKPDAAILLLQRALAAGIQADYVLMDTWFTTEPMLEKFWRPELMQSGWSNS